ncbi:MAG: hypothetical protein MRZ79_20800 [Bacteroidia bacterium]|nr:hypothetical protein [Bacteroidia bacterium]
MKYLFIALSLLILLSSSACETIECIEEPGCQELFTFDSKGYCPNGYLFMDEGGNTVFVDYFLYAGEDISEDLFKELKKGDQVTMDLESLDQESFGYHYIDYSCIDGSKILPFNSVDRWATARCFMHNNVVIPQ